MRVITIENFSCIEHAEVEIEHLTILIGPQASGKSVIAKLCFFAIDTGVNQHSSIIRNHSYEKFCQDTREKFKEWFLAETWGKCKFRISYVCGGYAMHIVRKMQKGQASEDIKITFSDEFKFNYLSLLDQISKKKSQPPSSNTPVMDEWDQDWRFQQIIGESYGKLQGKGKISSQIFVPAGRSFFTSIGKAIAVFEQGRMLDPIILRFGRLFTFYKERFNRIYHGESVQDRDLRMAIEANMTKLLGGTFRKEGEREYVITDDSRKIALPALSSGQQELLPIALSIPRLLQASQDALCYVEEPEAHLFPLTQSHLVQSLISATSHSSLVITTHSPYVITTINTLLKAGQLGRKQNESIRKEVESVIPKRAWLSSKQVRAYAIQSKCTVSIMDSEGLIDGDYLDSISEELNVNFSKLLDTEVKYAQTGLHDKNKGHQD